MPFSAWRRTTEPGACAFCLMLASRGAVYRSEFTAGASDKYHTHCHCGAELETEPANADEVVIAPEDANRVIEFTNRHGSRYRYDLSDFRNRGVTSPPATPIQPPVAVKLPSRYAAGRDVHVPRDHELRGLSREEMASRRPKFNPDKPLEFYGDALSVTGDSPKVKRALKELESLPRHVHETLRDYFLSAERGGIYIGDVRGIPQLDDLGNLKGVRPRGWPPGSTWDRVGGVNSRSNRVVAIATEGRDGSASVMLHECGHAYDAALNIFGIRAEQNYMTFTWHWTNRASRGKEPMPYFSQSGNPSGWISEAYAESFAAYFKARASKRSTVSAVAEALGIRRAESKILTDFWDQFVA